MPNSTARHARRVCAAEWVVSAVGDSRSLVSNERHRAVLPSAGISSNLKSKLKGVSSFIRCVNADNMSFSLEKSAGKWRKIGDAVEWSSVAELASAISRHGEKSRPVSAVAAVCCQGKCRGHLSNPQNNTVSMELTQEFPFSCAGSLPNKIISHIFHKFDCIVYLQKNPELFIKAANFHLGSRSSSIVTLTQGTCGFVSERRKMLSRLCVCVRRELGESARARVGPFSHSWGL